jgi:hypothetical protein
MLYTVESVGDFTTLEGITVALTKEEVSKYLRPSFAQVYHSAQGLTLQGRVQLCDTAHTHFTSRMLLVGLSRATNADLVQVCD